MITEILKKYGAGEITAEEANKQLDEANAGISVDPLKGCVCGCWSKRETAEGFFDPVEMGFEPKKNFYPDTPVLKRVKAFANLTVIQPTAAGEFEVTYDEDGYAVRAHRVNG